MTISDVLVCGGVRMATTQERRREEIERISDGIVQAYNRGEPDRVDDVVTDDFVCHLTGGVDVIGPSAYKDRIRTIRAAFPDFEKTEEALLRDGDMGAVHYRWGGTHEGEFAGVPPTGRRVETTSLALLRFEGGRLAEMWAYGDGETLQKQLGVAD
jgi:steroid delta-isomerase-like uncharacterized protein